MMERQTSLTQSVTRALNILQCFNDETPELRVTDICARLGLTASLVSRLLITLEYDGFVERDPESSVYRLGRSIITLAGVALNHNQLRVEALTEMQRVSAETGLGVNLSVLDNDSIYYLAHVDGKHTPRAYTLIGRRNPLHATAMGKVLLAYLPPKARIACLEGLTLHAYTVHTIADAAQLEAELDNVVTQGYATEVEELALGRACISCPVRDRRGNVIAAMSISGPLSSLKLDHRRQELIDLTMETADRVSIRLGYITAPRMVTDWRPPQPLPNNAKE
jgi:DNA-binding IclR family transcriptional regulator